MPNVIFIPGCMGTELLNDSQANKLVWANVNRLCRGAMRWLRLKPDGLSPIVDWQRLYPGDPLKEAYGKTLSNFRKALDFHGIPLRTWGYDWRLDVIAQGSRLGSHIEETYTTENPVIVVGHSQGGLLARAAYQRLKSRSKSHLIRRIITLGTPNRGTYSPVVMWLLANKDARRMSANSKGDIFNPAIEMSVEEIADITATFPAMYDLLPHLDEASLQGDFTRDQLYKSSFYPRGVNVSQDRLDQQKNVRHAYWRDADTIPDGDKLVTVAGEGTTTITSLEAIQTGFLRQNGRHFLDPYRGFDTTRDGDGTVTVHSALIDGAKQLKVSLEHEELFKGMVYSGDLLKLVREVPDPTMLALAPVKIRVEQTNLIADIPLFTGGTLSTAPPVAPSKSIIAPVVQPPGPALKGLTGVRRNTRTRRIPR